MQAVTRCRSLLLLLWLILAFGCAETPQRPSGPDAGDPDVVLAERLFESGQYREAAEVYQRLVARSVTAQQRAAFLLAAAEAARLAGDWDGVRQALAQLAQSPPAGDQALQQRLLQAEVMLQEQRPEEAFAALGAAPVPGTPDALRIRYYRDLAATYRQLGNLLETAAALQEVDALQTERADRLATQSEILRSLALLNEQVLRDLQPSPPGVLGGWMELALLVKQYGAEPDRLQELFAQWRERFPQHPALPELLSDYRQQLQGQLQHYDQIAVLLPQSGTLANVASAIRDGILISRFELPPAQRPTLRFYDATDQANIWPLYSQAITEGAQIVIGPLQKEAVAQMMRAGDLPVPVLALNQVDIDRVPNANLFMYSLSPEDEARQAAERIWQDGHRRPVILAPQGAWGDRMSSAFEGRWRTLGGSVAGTGRYDEASHDYTDTITQVLRLDRSEARHRELEGWLGRNLEFEPSRRDDVDAVFMAANPVQAQGLRPQLQFHHAADLPIYATSNAWSGTLAQNQVEDMKGIMLADIPWLVSSDPTRGDDREVVARYLPKSGSGYARLYAMGMDAMRLVPHLKRLQSSPYESLDGSTGNLYMDETFEIHRQLVWLELGAEPKILGFAPRMDLQAAAMPAPGDDQALGGTPAAR